MRTRLTAITLLLLAAATAFAQTHSGEVTPTWTQPTQPGVGWDSGIYRYDGSGNIARIGDDTFAYDGANRLAYSTIHAYRATTTQSFQYDRYGNVLNVVTDVDDPTDPRDPEPSAFTVDAQTNRLTRLCRGTQPCVSFTYDGAGNQTAHGTQVTYAWDAAGAMTELTGSIAHERYVYDANDERVLLVTLDGTQEVARRWTWRDASNKVAREAVEHVGTNVWSDARDYVYRDGALLASFESSAAPIAERHYHLDHLGTPRLITDAGRNKRAEDVYLPFGEKAAGTSIAYIGHTERMRFTGHERDGEGSPYRPTLDYMHARYYLGEGKRFLSVDPTWESADNGKPQSWNRYAYVMNNPVNFTDPDGKCIDGCVIETWIVIGGIAAAGAGKVWLESPSPSVPGKTNAEVLGSQIAAIPGKVGTFLLSGGGSSGEMAAETMIQNWSESRARQLGDRAKDGSVGDAVDQLDSLQERQKRIRKGTGSGIIDTTGKSEQRVRDALNRIKDLKDAEEDEQDAPEKKEADEKTKSN